MKTEWPLIISERFFPFLRNEKTSWDYEVLFREVDRLPKHSADWLYRELAFDVGSDTSGHYYRMFRDLMEENQPYASAYYDWERRKIEVLYLASGRGNLNQSDNAFFHIAWETMLQLENRMILHACAVAAAESGILFSGRSGIGKSTQGELWCQYENAELVNGDRPVLYQEEGVWYACGAPYAGSSRCHRDIRVPVQAIVILGQAKECTIRKINPAAAFRRLYAEMTISSWNSDCVKRSCDLTAALTEEVPVFELNCTPDKRAVELLKQTLPAEGNR